jgi:hypothetical protein
MATLEGVFRVLCLKTLVIHRPSTRCAIWRSVSKITTAKAGLGSEHPARADPTGLNAETAKAAPPETPAG